MMRDGMLVLDGFTDSIISNHGCTTLEDTFLKICMASPKKMEKELEFLADPVVDCNLKECKRSVFDCKPHQRSQLTVKCRTLKAIIVKNFLIILRFRG